MVSPRAEFLFIVKRLFGVYVNSVVHLLKLIAKTDQHRRDIATTIGKATDFEWMFRLGATDNFDCARFHQSVGADVDCAITGDVVCCANQFRDQFRVENMREDAYLRSRQHLGIRRFVYNSVIRDRYDLSEIRQRPDRLIRWLRLTNEA